MRPSQRHFHAQRFFQSRCGMKSRAQEFRLGWNELETWCT
jgi:hypothetical protein